MSEPVKLAETQVMTNRITKHNRYIIWYLSFNALQFKGTAARSKPRGMDTVSVLWGFWPHSLGSLGWENKCHLWIHLLKHLYLGKLSRYLGFSFPVLVFSCSHDLNSDLELSSYYTINLKGSPSSLCFKALKCVLKTTRNVNCAVIQLLLLK